MSRVLILYGTTEGQTAKISRYIGGVLEESGHTVELADAQKLPAGLKINDFDGVLIGASMHASKHDSRVRDFVKANHAALDEMPSGFFSVSLTAAEPKEEDKAGLYRLIAEFFDETGWHPEKVGIFAGPLLYTQYNFIKRMLMKMVMKRGGKPTDTSRDYEYTDWEGIAQYARTFSSSLTEAN
jgi:menaquinone-dependent protoporphyrinogen oxidase